MDQASQPTTPTPQIAPAPQAAAAPAPTSPVSPQTTQHAKKSSHKGLLIVIGAALILAFLGGAAYLLLQNESTTQITQTQIQSTTTQYEEPTPTTAQAEGTVEEVEAIMIEDTSEVTEIQADLNQL